MVSSFSPIDRWYVNDMSAAKTLAETIGVPDELSPVARLELAYLVVKPAENFYLIFAHKQMIKTFP